jgi:monoamine oxidase
MDRRRTCLEGILGSFGSFGPGQFVQSYRSLTCPAANGRLHFAGESVSVRHG